ncbi:MAG TPA: hypothetical protein VK096_05360, partial [Actinomycetales bacterium]|nr:hypothetical protein [Actinomycetales bacterium]
MRKKLLGAAGVLALASSTLVLTALPASAADYEFEIEVYESDSPVVGWSKPNGNPDICEDVEIEFLERDAATGDFNPTDVAAPEIVINEFRNGGTMDLSGVPAGWYQVRLDCGSFDFEIEVDFARYIVTKQVEGDGPEDAAFGMDVMILDGDEAYKTYPIELKDGESAEFYDFAETHWSVTETDDGGAKEVRIANAEFISEVGVEHTATVTNVFDSAAPDPAPEEPAADAPEPSDESEDEAPVVKK